MMRLLLDTHVAVWCATKPRTIGASVFELIQDPRHDVFVSAISILEIGIKFDGSRRHRMPFSGPQAIEIFKALNFILLDVSPAHAVLAADVATAHGDPFDRLILAQALSENLHLVTADAKLAAYSDTVITW